MLTLRGNNVINMVVLSKFYCDTYSAAVISV